ncbi:hypothetical protein H5410_031068 [Solanum commersonii]|uniref:Uncharacterized protein n=1 Tax=Solanum commersonii TaxID=4109 RepID=A0A9J5YHC4_SOLCO|nr:hypothetical protein H5410_031068 [Solanum commersonii]
MSQQDPYMMEALKIHVQILGAPQARDAIQDTLNYQLAWRVQNHVMNLSLPSGQDAMFLNVDATNGTTQCTHISRKICRDEIVKVLSHTWIVSVRKDNLDSESILKFFRNDLDWIKEFGHDGIGVFWYKCPFTRHIPWDIDCDCTECEEDYYGFEDDDEMDCDEYSYDRANAAKPHKEEPEFDIAKLVWERKDAMAAQKGAEEAQARSKCKKVSDLGAMMISNYKASNENSIFVDLSPIVEDLTISEYEKSDSEKELDALVYDTTNSEDWFFKTHGFSNPILGMNNQVCHDDYLRCDEHLDDLNLEHLDDIDFEHDLEDNYPSNGYIKDSKSSTNSQEYVDNSEEYVEETAESLLESNEEDYPPITSVSKVDDDQDYMTDNPIPERRPQPMNTIPKNLGTRFHTFTLDDVKDPRLLYLDGYKEFSQAGKVHDPIRIYFKLGGDSSLKQAFVSLLPKMLAVHAMKIIEDRFKSITIPHIGYIRQAIFQDLDKRQKSVKQYQWFKLSRPPHNRSRMTRCTKFLEEDIGYFAKNCPKSKRSVKILQFFEDIADHTRIYLSKDNNFELVFSLEYTIKGNPYDQDDYKASRVIEFFPDLQFRTKLLGSAVLGRDLIIGFDIFTQLKDRLERRTRGITFRQQFKPYKSMSKLFQISIMKKRTYYELQVFKKYGGSILKPIGVHPEYPQCHVFILIFPKNAYGYSGTYVSSITFLWSSSATCLGILIESNQPYRNFYYGFDHKVGGVIASKIPMRLRYSCCTVRSKIDQQFPSIGSFWSLFCPWKMNITKLNELSSSKIGMNITKLNELSSSKIGVSQKKYVLRNGFDGTTLITTPIGRKSDKLRKNIKSRPSNKNRYFTKSTKQSLEKKELYKKKYGFD